MSVTVANMKPKTPPKQHKGFRVMAPELVTKIARMGGKAVAKKRGRKHMALIGRKGGKAPHKGHAQV